MTRDPTHTVTIQKRFEAEFYNRFRLIKGRINDEIVKRDGFGLRQNQFRFTRDDQKVSAFMEWLKDEQGHTLQVYEGRPLASSASGSWMNTYVSNSYQTGIQQAASELRRAGAEVLPEWALRAFTRPIHADRLGLAFTRTYSDLKGITDEMDKQISRVLAEGLGAGLNPRRIASQINNRVDKIGLTRARTLARTEVIAAHADATLNSFQEAGLQEVDLEAELLTAGDACPRCKEVAARGPYTLVEARGMLPLHPNCRCAWKPRVVNGTGIVLR